MKKAMARSKKKRAMRSRRVAPDEILPEYDFSRGRANPYAERYAASEGLVKLDPDVASFFPNATSVNDALRALVGIIQQHTSNKRPMPRNALRPRARRQS
jgi:hypothetical protein